DPEKLGELLSPRFDVYASLVRKITVRHSTDWDYFVDTVSHRPLLPNLRSLFTANLDSGLRTGFSDVFCCARALLCPSLVEIGVSSHYNSSTEVSLVSRLLKSSTNIASNLQTLRLVVHGWSKVPYNKSTTFSDLVLFRNIRTLECTTAMIDSAVLPLIGTLSQLDSFIVQGPIADTYTDSEDPLYLDDLVLPPDSFPVLRHLKITGLTCTTISQLWRHAPLVRQLVSVGVWFNYPDYEPTQSEINNAVRNICESSPYIIELYLDTPGLIYDLWPATMQTLRQLSSLQRLELPGSSTAESPEDFTLFISGAVKLEYLTFGFGFAGFDDLMLFARQMPKLRFLSLVLVLTRWPTNIEPEIVSPSPSTLCLRSGYQFSKQFEEDELNEDEAMEAYIDNMAR
ncbi:hypothetical protein FRC07_014124, partial [Ceratobasidium sp. 392]